MNIKKTFLIVSVDTRIENLKKLLESIYTRSQFKEWFIICVLQNYNKDQKMLMEAFVDQNDLLSPLDRTELIFVDGLVGPHSARIIGLESTVSDIWCNLDDDMEIIDQANFSPIIRELNNDKSVGFISGNWIRSESMLPKKKIKNAYVKQAIVYTGGGLFYRSDIAELMRKHPNKNYLFDDVEWSMTAFVNGYKNYRYLGSVIIHRVCTKGGRRIWVAQKNRDLSDPKLITLEPASEFYKGVDNNYKIPASKNLTQLAKDLHKANEKGK